METLAARIRYFRCENGFTQKEVSKGIEVLPQTVQKFESGERTPSENQLQALAKLFGCSYGQLININETQELLDILNVYARNAAMGCHNAYDAFLSDLNTFIYYQELQEFWDEMCVEISQSDPEIYNTYLKGDVDISQILQLFTMWQNIRNDKNIKEKKPSTNFGTSRSLAQDSEYKAFFGCAISLFLCKSDTQSISKDIQNFVNPKLSNCEAVQYFACNGFIHYINTLIIAIEACRDGVQPCIADAFLFEF